MSKEKEERKLFRARVNVGTEEEPVWKWVQGYTPGELARAKAAKLKEYGKEQKKQTPPPPPKPKRDAVTFRRYVASWYTLYKEPHIRPSTAKMYRSLLDRVLLPKLGDIPLEEITRADVQRLLNTLTGRAKSTIKKCRLMLTEIFDSAVDDDLIPKSPARRLRLPEGTQKLVLPVPPDQIPSLVAHCQKDPDGLFPLLLLYTGLRRGEALALRWRDIGEEEISVTRALTFQGNAGVIGPTKTAAGNRRVPLLPPVRRKLGKRGAPDDLVFSGAEPMTSTVYRNTWNRIQRHIPELAGVHPHQLRHTYTDILRHAGVDPKTAQYFLGHEDYSTTANIYSRIDERDTSLGGRKILSYLQSEAK